LNWGDFVKNNVVQEKSYAFSLSVIALYRDLLKQNEFVLSKQLLRSGTSIGANARPVK
jgi:four helix bundle protein